MSRFFYIGVTQPTQAQLNAALEQFAELLSFDLSLADIAERMQISVGSACVLLSNLCGLYGEKVAA